MRNFKEIDSYKSWQYIKQQIEKAVKIGELSNKEAHSILKEAKESYRNQALNKTLARRGYA